jgi:hypothetical protein
MREILQENSAILQRVLKMTVPYRTDKSGRIHPRRPVTLDYLDEQGEEQIAYYQDYRQHVQIGFWEPAQPY